MEFILAAGIIYFLGHLLTHLFERSKIPDVLMLILLGMLLGPVTGIVETDIEGAWGKTFTQIALIIILFESGLDTELRMLIKTARLATVLTVSFFVMTVTAVALVMHQAFDYSPMASVMTGFICGGTSSAVVIPLLSMINVEKRMMTTLIMESALTDVLCIVFTIGQLNSFKSGDFEYGKIVGTIVSSLVIASLIGILGGVMWLRTLPWVRTFRNTQYATCFFMFIIFGVSELMGFSGAIASLSYGIVLGNSQMLSRRMPILMSQDTTSVVTDAERKLYKELVFLVKIFFFLYMGLSIPLKNVEFVKIALSIVVILYVMRPLAIRLIMPKGSDAKDCMTASVMIPKGLAAAVLAGMPTEAGMIEGSDIQSITFHIVLYSIILTSVLIPLTERTKVGNIYKKIFSIGKKEE